MIATVPALKLRSLILVQPMILLLVTAGVAYLWGIQPGASFGVGALVMLTNLLLLAWIWSRHMEKKPVALTTVIIVVKYTVLLGAIFLLTREAWFHVLAAGLGMAAFILSTIIQVGTAKWE